MIYEINLFDNAFRHLTTPDGKYSMVHGKTPKNMKYIRNEMNYDGLTMFTDDCIYMPYIDDIKSKYKAAWLLEPRALQPIIYDRIITVIEKYDFIFTHDKQLINDYPTKAKFVPFGGCWIQDENQKIHNKTKNISMIYSNKTFMAGHMMRHRVADMVKGIDLFGNGSKTPIEFKEEGLCDYRFSVVIENIDTQTWFTEKLLDCFATGTIPLYWGTPDIGDYFNLDGMIKFRSINELSEIILKLSDDDYNNRLDAVRDNFERFKQYEITEDWICDNILEEL